MHTFLLILSIDGMSSGDDVNAVRGALDRIPGVAVEKVAMGSARVSYDPGKISPEEIIQILANEGYLAAVHP